MNANRYQFNSVVRMFAAIDEDTANKVADVINAADMVEQDINGHALVNTFKHKAAAIVRVPWISSTPCPTMQTFPPPTWRRLTPPTSITSRPSPLVFFSPPP